jgi:cysteine synthase A
MKKTIQRNITDCVGKTPFVQLIKTPSPNVKLFAKLEGYNPSGSVKDRAAAFILTHQLKSNNISKKTKIIESSSGNFGISLSVFCNKFGLQFTSVIDPNINPINETIIRNLGANVIKVSNKDKNGGYLLTRIDVVKKFLDENIDSYWTNQYSNPLNASAYLSLGKELLNDCPKLDYVFMGVSSGGTITGVSKKIKEQSPTTKIIAVDVRGSVIFNQMPQKRYLPGIGSSLKPSILKEAIIDEVVIVDEQSSINECYRLLKEESLLCGGSSGSVMAAVKKYFAGKTITSKINVAMVFADRGERYSDTIYNNKWVKERFPSIKFI